LIDGSDSFGQVESGFGTISSRSSCLDNLSMRRGGGGHIKF